MRKKRKQFFRPISSEIRKKRLVAVFIVAVAVVGFFSAFMFAGASFQYQWVKSTIASWHTNQGISKLQDYEQVRNAIATAEVLHGTNPLYIDLAGQIQEWGAVSGFADSNALHNAKLRYIHATQIRPLWPVTWANLAMIKWRLEEFDEEMLNYLYKANELGPYKVEVHVLFTRLGISLYKANHPMYGELKDIIHKHIRLGLRNTQSKEMVSDFVITTQMLATVCLWIKVNDEYANQYLPCA